MSKKRGRVKKIILRGKPVDISKIIKPKKTVTVHKVGEASGQCKELMKMGLSYQESVRMIISSPSEFKGSKHPQTSAPKKLEPGNNKKHGIDISQYKMSIYTFGVNIFDGITFVKDDALAEGYFFVSDLSALEFLNDSTFNGEDKIAAIQKQKNTKFMPIKNEVSFIDSTARRALKDRPLLCEKIKDAIKQNGATTDKEKESVLRRIFNKESRLKFDEVQEFLKFLYNTNNLSGAQYVVEDELNQIFSFDGVKMQGTMEKATLISYPKERAADVYIIPTFVEKIATGAFVDADRLESIKIGNRVRVIEKEAFVDNTSLVSITIPEGVKEVQDGAFTRCTNLRIAIIKSKEKMISSKMFIDCPSLETLVTNNETLRNNIEGVKVSSKSSIKLVMHKKDKVVEYPYLKHDSRIIVMGNIYNCIKHNHNIKSLWVNVPMKDKNGPKDAPICVFYCTMCRRYFILPDIYEYYLMRYDFKSSKLFVPLIYSGWYNGPKLNAVSDSSWDMKERSILRDLGYTVSATVGLTSKERMDILRYAIEHGIVTKHEVEQYLEFFMKFQGAKDGSEEAYLKWNEDLVNVHKKQFRKIKYWDMKMD